MNSTLHSHYLKTTKTIVKNSFATTLAGITAVSGMAISGTTVFADEVQSVPTESAPVTVQKS